MTEALTRMTTALSLTLERNYEHPLTKLYAAFTHIDAKRQWYGDEVNWEVSTHTLDFKVGGWEHWRGRRGVDGPWMTNDALFYDIVPEARIITGYTMTMNGHLFTASQQVLEFSGTATGSHLKLTEQIIYVDRPDHHEDRIRGTELGMLQSLDDYLKSTS